MDVTRSRSVAASARRRRPPDRRNQLAAIAAGLFARDGYHNVGVNDIAAAAGITGPAVYRHFPSKQAILGHVVLSGLDEFASTIADAYQQAIDRPDAERLAVLAASVSRLVVERRELGAMWRREGRNLPAEDRASLAVLARRATRFGVQALLPVRPSLTESDADLLCWAALSVFGSVSDHHVTLPRTRFENLLTSMALDVLCSELPAAGGDWSSGDGGSSPDPSRREQLLTLAARMFCEHGFHAVTMEGIGAAAGATGPSIYRHYAGKADLLLAMCRRVGDHLQAGVDAAASAAAPREALDLLVRSFVGTVLRHRDHVAAYLTEGANLPERDRTDLRRLQRRYVAEWVKPLRALDLDDRTARIRVHAAFAVVNDLARTGRFTTRPHLPAELTHLATNVLGGRPTADAAG